MHGQEIQTERRSEVMKLHIRRHLNSQTSNGYTGFEDPRTILHHQPQLIPPPSVPLPESRPHTRSSSQEWIVRTRSFASRASSRGSYSLKRKLNMYNGSTTSTKKPYISAPTDFRHVQPSPPPYLPRRSFRPLELSIYLPANQLSPILPHFDDDPATPRPAHTRTVSALSNFSIPRKAVPSYYYQRPSYDAEFSSADTTPESVAGSFTHPLRPRPSLPGSLSTQQLLAALDDEPLSYPPPARLRSNTLPILSEQVERVKSVLLEREALDRRIRDVDDLIVERRSMSLKSRPASIYTSCEGSSPQPPTARPKLTTPRTNAPPHDLGNRASPPPHHHAPPLPRLNNLLHLIRLSPSSPTPPAPPPAPASPEEEILLPRLNLALRRTQPPPLSRQRDERACPRDSARRFLPVR